MKPCPHRRNDVGTNTIAHHPGTISVHPQSRHDVTYDRGRLLRNNSYHVKKFAKSTAFNPARLQLKVALGQKCQSSSPGTKKCKRFPGTWNQGWVLAEDGTCGLSNVFNDFLVWRTCCAVAQLLIRLDT